MCVVRLISCINLFLISVGSWLMIGALAFPGSVVMISVPVLCMLACISSVVDAVLTLCMPAPEAIADRLVVFDVAVGWHPVDP